MNLLHDLQHRDKHGHVRVVVEVPRGSSVKLKYDEHTRTFVWSRTLTLGVVYPYDFGFLPQTLAGDGDALDALVFAEASSYPGVVVPGRPLGALRVEQQRPGQAVRRNDRILVAPLYAHRQDALEDIDRVAERVRDEIQAFFAASLALTGKTVRFCGWADAAEAEKIVDEAHARYSQRRQRRQANRRRPRN
ncbi:Inorganic pyrophosphatase [Haliangium ochraceum DSM 14365]|uniref:inorganic diphosphatase n=1 Tax=Haliangium ochraceum (strain DSM 14365 / JCM 11303 / SMP-2) TaxID=502025 RepID=D0LGK3_HALO1|nr:Inorganic pyrophosphatase [Haliangium ochraceum DSM 14365]